MICERAYNVKTKIKIIKNEKEGKEELLNLKGLNIYINNLMHQLWEQPKLIYLILSNSNIKDIKNNLAYFFCNNFYENILNPNLLQNNLLFVISLLLKKEINNLRSIKDVNLFLMETTSGFLLEQLKERKDVQLYFKKILFDVIMKTEEVFSSKEINLDIKVIEEEIKKLKEGKNDPKSLIEKKELKTFYLEKNKEITLDFDEERKEKEPKLDKDEAKKKLFYKKYMLNMTLDELKRINTLNKENQDKDIKNDMKIYIDHHINLCVSNEEMYQNKTFFNGISKSKYSQDIFSIYQNKFIGLTEIISQLLQNLLDNINLVPYSIKAISQIIILLVKKKFPNITIIEQNMFLSKFFFNQLLSDMLSNPSLFLLINNIISDNTINNLKLISSLLIKFVSCKFYQNYINECNFIPFNWFFMDEMPKIIKFFKTFSKNVKLPLIINKLINGELEKNLKFEYFEEKSDEIIGHKSICYSYNDLFILLENINRCKNILFTDDKNSLLKKTYEKLVKENAEKIFDNIRNNPQYETIVIHKSKKEKEEIKIPIIKYFLISDLLINNNKTDLLFANKTNDNSLDRDNYSIKKNICTILSNNKIIDESDFSINDVILKNIDKITMIEILNKFKELNNLSHYSFDGSTSENKIINWIINDLSSLNEDLKKNDFHNLLIQIYQENKSSISSNNYNDLIYCIDKLQVAEKYNTLYKDVKNIIFDIDINNKVKSIVENENIPIEIHFKYDEDKKELKIEKIHNQKKTGLSKDETKRNSKNFISFEMREVCPTINSFINTFPDIAIISVLNEDNIFEIFKQIKISQNLEEYFDFIKSNLTKTTNKNSSKNLTSLSEDINNFFDKEELEKIIMKIKDYIIEKLYEKIFPKNPDFLDNKIYLNSLKLSWTEPKHYLKEEVIGKDNSNFDFRRFVGELKILMKNIEKEKVPWKKVELIYNILEIMDKCFMNEVKVSYGQDFFKNLLIYSIVKIQPSWLHSNCQYIKAFIEYHKNKTGESIFEILTEACKFFEEITPEKLLGVTEKEFNEKCEKSFNNI